MTQESSSPLQRLFSQCRELHDGILSLQQLVPVHRSLCSCCSVTSLQGFEATATTTYSSLDPILGKCSEEERSLCDRLLTGTDSEKLLAVQYLSYPLPPLESLQCVVVPYLLSQQVSADLILALLDTVDSAVNDGAQNATCLSAILQQCLQSSQRIASRILIRLVKASPLSTGLLQALYDKIWQVLEAAVVDSKAFVSVDVDHQLLSSLSKDLLPLLTTKTEDGRYVLSTELHRPFITVLWSRLFSLWSTNPSNDEERRKLLLILTTVLCPLLQCVLDQEMPLITNDDNDTTAPQQRPLEQPILWQLIHTCLAQGKSLLEPVSSSAAILRKRALYLLRILAAETSDVWKTFVMCLETLEMESEQHLVDQIWESVVDLMSCVDGNSTSTMMQAGVFTWDWMSLLFARALSSDQPALRKLSMYRLLNSQAGILLAESEGSTLTTNKNKKGAGKKRTRNVKTLTSGKTLDIVTPEFILTILLPSWDSLGNIGYILHLEENRKVLKEDMVPLFITFLQAYVDSLKDNTIRRQEFWRGLWKSSLISKLKVRTIVPVFSALSQHLSNIPADDDMLKSLVETFQVLFGNCSVVLTYRKELLSSLATMLAHCQSSESTKWSPLNVLQILALFSPEYFNLELEEWTIVGDTLLDALRRWIGNFDQDAATVGATVATAFVGGYMRSPISATSTAVTTIWDPTVGATVSERDLAWAIPLLCTLAVESGSSSSKENQTTVGELLWPAIYKGLTHSTTAILASNNKADHVTRALLLLENGCKLRLLSGLGNGDLVVDRNTQKMMPPPPNIEAMLSSSVSFILHHIRTLVSIKADASTGRSTRSHEAKRSSKTFAGLIAQIRTLRQSFPSSMAVLSAVDELLKSSLKALKEGTDSDDQMVKHVALIYAAVSSGADPIIDSHMSTCRELLQLQLSSDSKWVSKAWEKTARSILHYSKWGAISCILPLLLESVPLENDRKSQEVKTFLEELFVLAFDAVQATPPDALLPLFKCVIVSGNRWISVAGATSEQGEQVYVENLERLILALFALMDDCNASDDAMYMLNEICALVFHPKLLADELGRLDRNPDCATPVRDGFRRLIQMAGTHRPHITRSVLCRIAVGWLGVDEDKTTLGLSAIPYREDIVQLLLHKELRIDESASNQSGSRLENISGIMELPPGTDDLSVTRGFVLVFLSKLPDINDGLNNAVLTSLLHYIILRLIDEAAPADLKNIPLIMKGAPAYCLKMRAWQALCTLTRFVTSEIASDVCSRAFYCMAESLHGQLRYFIEIFTIQCARKHPDVFGSAFLTDIALRDLSLQHVSSLVRSAS
jgi:hypothetical protein